MSESVIGGRKGNGQRNPKPKSKRKTGTTPRGKVSEVPSQKWRAAWTIIVAKKTIKKPSLIRSRGKKKK